MLNAIRCSGLGALQWRGLFLAARRAPCGGLLPLLVTAIQALALSTVWWASREVGAPAVLACYTLFLTAGGLFAMRTGRTGVDLFLMAYAASAVVSVALFYLYQTRYGTPYYVGGSDDLQYELMASRVASSLGPLQYGSIRGGVVPASHNSVGFVYLVSLLVRVGDALGGFHTLIPRLFNGMLLGWMSSLTFVLGRLVGLPSQHASRSAAAVALLPIGLFTSAHTFRDVFVALACLFVVCVWVPVPNRRGVLADRLCRWMVTIPVVLVTYEFRSLLAVSMIGLIIVGDLIGRPWDRRMPDTIYRVVIITVIFAAAYVSRDLLVDKLEWLRTAYTRYATYRIGLSDGLAARIFALPLPAAIPLRVAYALISPLPALSGGPETIWVGAGTVVHLVFLPALAVGLLECVVQRRLWIVALAFAVPFAATALVTFQMRHIVTYLPYAAVIVGYATSRHRCLLLSVLLMVCAGAMLGVTYAWLKM